MLGIGKKHIHIARNKNIHKLWSSGLWRRVVFW